MRNVFDTVLSLEVRYECFFRYERPMVSRLALTPQDPLARRRPTLHGPVIAGRKCKNTMQVVAEAAAKAHIAVTLSALSGTTARLLSNTKKRERIA
jgi:hypothetical protein